MKAAFRKFGDAKKPYIPKLTIVICGKRHHTRFFPTEERFADQNGNPRPGTVVDRGVTAVYGMCSLMMITSFLLTLDHRI
jgi:eukaryotic translation initiation factor 2C